MYFAYSCVIVNSKGYTNKLKTSVPHHLIPLTRVECQRTSTVKKMEPTL